MDIIEEETNLEVYFEELSNPDANLRINALNSFQILFEKIGTL